MINAALVDANGMVVDVFVVTEMPSDLVFCPEHVGIGMHIDSEPPPIAPPLPPMPNDGRRYIWDEASSQWIVDENSQ